MTHDSAAVAVEQLLPCPFCGGSASREFFASSGWTIFCDACHASAATEPTKGEAIAAWNTRPTPGPSDGECDLGPMHGFASCHTTADGVRRCDFCGHPVETSDGDAGLVEAALVKARDTFRHYAELHKAKATPDGEVKAMHNTALCAEMDLAITALTRPAEDQAVERVIEQCALIADRWEARAVRRIGDTRNRVIWSAEAQCAREIATAIRALRPDAGASERGV